ncbi:MAG: cation diffusion facilitator family transporter [Clostridia bacterium]|nr:cation diffusion facilitator family transporter [Clostridia bacterium]
MNFLLFAVKFYVGLSANSISIYSDGINNLFDSLSGALSVICFYFAFRSTDLSSSSRSEKTEQFLSFVLSVIVAVAGFVFAYNSAERLMYPTPVWFTYGYLWILVATAVVKLLMAAFFRYKHRKLGSEVLKVMSVDSLLDFFITAVTVVTLLLSQKGTYSLDAYCGILISIMILISGIRMTFSSGKKLLNLADENVRGKIQEILSEGGIDKEKAQLEYSLGNESRVYLKTDEDIGTERLSVMKKQVYEQTGIKLYIVK